MSAIQRGGMKLGSIKQKKQRTLCELQDHLTVQGIDTQDEHTENQPSRHFRPVEGQGISTGD